MDFCTKQEIASISITWNRGKSGDRHTYKLTYIRISEIKVVMTQETQAGHVLDRNQSAAKSAGADPGFYEMGGDFL